MKEGQAVGFLEMCKFVELSPNTINACRNFSCTKDADIEEFFKTEYFGYAQQLLGKTYGFTTDSCIPSLVCAFTLANSSISTDRMPGRQRNRLNRSIPNEKRRRQYPAVLIGQLSVFDKYSGKRIGDELLDFIKALMIDTDIKSACRYLIVDAVNHPKVLNFYARNGFQTLFDSDEEELAYLGKDGDHTNDTSIKTRLMFFDLIKLRR